MSIGGILGYIIVLVLICINLNGYDGFYYFLDAPSMFFTIVFFLLTIGGTKTIADLRNGIKIGLGKKSSYSMLELKKSEEALHLIIKSMLLFGATFCLMSFISILYVMELIQIGPLLAPSLCTALYSLIIALFLTPFKGKLHMLLIAYAEENASKEEILSEEILEQRVFYLFRSKGLTDREAEIARLVSDGLTNREIAGKLYISEATVKKHITHILEKLELDNRESIVNMIRQELTPS